MTTYIMTTYIWDGSRRFTLCRIAHIKFQKAKDKYMQDAQQRWGCMTNFDLSTIKNELQLSSMVGAA
jgi:hypothetical protein